MDAPVRSPTKKSRPAKEKQDLRAWIAQLRAAGEVEDIKGAEREREIGGIVDIYQRRIGNRAVLFDDVPGFPRGHRILANILTSLRRINITLGLDADATPNELIQYWRRTMRDARTIAPVAVQSGPVMENILTGSDIDIFKIPVPRWHEHDGGYYIGTGDMVIMRDPDTGWINYGAYRVQAQARNAATVMCSKGKHGDLIRRRYHQRGEPCPIAVICGMHPTWFMIACLEIPYGKNEFEAAGGLIGEAVEVIAGPRTGLPIPAHAEIAFRRLHPPERSARRRPARRMDRLLRRRSQERAGDPDRNIHAPRRSDPARGYSRHSARRRFVLSRHLSCGRSMKSARSRWRARSERRLGASRRRQPAMAHGRDQAAICRSRQASRPHRLAVSRRRLRQPFRHRSR